jgi:ankyrin repeat protein
MDNVEYICDLIIENDGQIYFDDERHFEDFLESPKYVKYYEKYENKKINILFYLTYERYDLMETVIDNKLFNKIDINQLMTFNKDGFIYNLNMLMFSCLYSKKLSSNTIVETLLEQNKIDINLQNKDGYSALILASRHSGTTSTEETVKLLLKEPIIDINLQDKHGWSALIWASQFSRNRSTIETVKMLLENSDININLQDKYGWTALMFAAISSNFYSTEDTVKLLLDKSNININLRADNSWSALTLAIRNLDTSSTVETIIKLLKCPKIDISVKDKNGETPLIILIKKKYKTPIERIVRIFLDHPQTNLSDLDDPEIMQTLKKYYPEDT